MSSLVDTLCVLSRVWNSVKQMMVRQKTPSLTADGFLVLGTVFDVVDSVIDSQTSDASSQLLDHLLSDKNRASPEDSTERQVDVLGEKADATLLASFIRWVPVWISVDGPRDLILSVALCLPRDGGRLLSLERASLPGVRIDGWDNSETESCRSQ